MIKNEDTRQDYITNLQNKDKDGGRGMQEIHDELTSDYFGSELLPWQVRGLYVNYTLQFKAYINQIETNVRDAQQGTVSCEPLDKLNTEIKEWCEKQGGAVDEDDQAAYMCDYQKIAEGFSQVVTQRSDRLLEDLIGSLEDQIPKSWQEVISAIGEDVIRRRPLPSDILETWKGLPKLLELLSMEEIIQVGYGKINPQLQQYHISEHEDLGLKIPASGIIAANFKRKLNAEGKKVLLPGMKFFVAVGLQMQIKSEDEIDPDIAKEYLQNSPKEPLNNIVSEKKFYFLKIISWWTLQPDNNKDRRPATWFWVLQANGENSIVTASYLMDQIKPQTRAREVIIASGAIFKKDQKQLARIPWEEPARKPFTVKRPGYMDELGDNPHPSKTFDSRIFSPSRTASRARPTDDQFQNGQENNSRYEFRSKKNSTVENSQMAALVSPNQAGRQMSPKRNGRPAQVDTDMED